jgi:Tol biopolymer transport system component
VLVFAGTVAGTVAGAAALAACGDGKNPTAPGTPGIRMVAGDRTTDTISAEPVQALVVEVRDESGSLASGAVVRFESVLTNPQQMYGGYSAYVSRLDQSQFGMIAVDTTDARGRASARFKLGITAGQAMVRVVVPGLGMADTATFTVQAGAAASVRAFPKDTALYPGRSFALRGSVVDRAGNPRTDPVTYAVAAGNISLASGTVTAQAEGRAKVLVQAMGLVDTSYVTVVPEGILAATSPSGGVVMFNTDGSGYKRLTPTTMSSWTTDWSPSGNEVVFDAPYGGPIHVVDLAGNVRTASNTPSTGMELYPEFSPDGSMIYFSREYWHLQRVRRDGTGDEAVPTNMPSSDVAPSLSPDGTRLVYVVAGGGGNDILRLLTVATGEVNAINISGHSPSWSPRGDLIAFIDPQSYTLKVMNTDGTGVRQVSAAAQTYSFGIDWSADGKWIVARNGTKNVIELIDPQTGTSLPLGFTAGMSGPSWRP